MQLRPWLAVTCVCLASLATPAPARRPANGGVARVGFVFSETGAAGVYGAGQRRGAELAVEEINAAAAPGQPVIEAIFEDDATDARVATKAFKKLGRSEKALLLIGPTLSGTAFVADPIAQHDGIPVVGVSNTVPGITAIGDFVFRDSLTEAVVIPNAVHAVHLQAPIPSAALIYQTGDTYTLGAAQAFRDALAADGIPLVAETTFARGDTDFGSQLAAIQAAQPGALLVASFVGEGAAIVSQARGLGVPAGGLIIGGNGLNAPAFLQLAGAAAEGVIVGAAWNPSIATPASQAFVAAFQQRFGAPPDQFAAQAYAGVQIAYAAILAAGTEDRGAVRDALAAVDGLPTVLGPFSFTPTRDAAHAPVVQVVQGGQFALYP